MATTVWFVRVEAEGCARGFSEVFPSRPSGGFVEVADGIWGRNKESICWESVGSCIVMRLGVEQSQHSIRNC